MSNVKLLLMCLQSITGTRAVMKTLRNLINANYSRQPNGYMKLEMFVDNPKYILLHYFDENVKENKS